jgi:tyrosinase
MTVTPKYPVAHPTWYDTIRLMFTQTDIDHMGNQDLDLTSYEQVQTASGNIYGQVASKNMPPGNPWSPDMVETFLNWMSDGCPKGTPTTDQVSAMLSMAATRTAVARIRKDVNSLSDDEKAAVKKAFEGIMAKDPSAISGRRPSTGCLNGSVSIKSLPTTHGTGRTCWASRTRCAPFPDVRT